jgi:hypothetical protein
MERYNLTLDEKTSPRNSFEIAGGAVETMSVWNPESYKDAARALALALAEELAPLARSVLQHPNSAWWFGPPDLDHQGYISHEIEIPQPLKWTSPGVEPKDFERSSQQPASIQHTSTLFGTDASLFASYEDGVGDNLIHHPLPCWEFKVLTRPRIFEIHSAEDWHELCVRYPAKGHDQSGHEGGWLVPNWGAVSLEWDGVHLSFGGVLTAEQVRFESDAGWTCLNFWHAEQTFWLKSIEAEVRILPGRILGKNKGFYDPTLNELTSGPGL